MNPPGHAEGRSVVWMESGKAWVVYKVVSVTEGRRFTAILIEEVLFKGVREAGKQELAH